MDLRARKLIMTHKALHLRGDIDSACQEKEEKDTPALKIARRHHYEDSKTTLKRAKKD